jgi:CheY-like chemotaxis protein
MSPKVLVVDDDQMIRSMLGAMLSHAGYEPVLADSARQALEICSDGAPPLGFLDIMMPDMDGMELAIAIKADHPDSHLIALSGHCPDSFEWDWREVGFDDFLKKPIDISTLLEAAANALNPED